jgi:hypothetical protein
MQPVGFVRASGVTAVSSPSPRPSPAGRGNHGSAATASQTRRVVQRGPVAPPLPAGEGRGEGERGPVENGPLHFHGSGVLSLLLRRLSVGKAWEWSSPLGYTKPRRLENRRNGRLESLRYRLHRLRHQVVIRVADNAHWGELTDRQLPADIHPAINVRRIRLAPGQQKSVPRARQPSDF